MSPKQCWVLMTNSGEWRAGTLHAWLVVPTMNRLGGPDGMIVAVAEDNKTGVVGNIAIECVRFQTPETHGGTK